MKKKMAHLVVLSVAAGSAILMVGATSAAAASSYNYSANAYGTYAFVGSTVKSGQSSPLGTGCGTPPGFHRTASVAAVTAAPLFTAATVQTSVTTATASSSSSSDIAGASILGGKISTGEIEAVSTTTAGAAGNTYSAAGSKLIGVTVNGTAIADNPAPNTTLAIPGVGKVVFNEQIRRGTSLTVNMIHLYVTAPQAGVLAGTQVVLGHAVSGLAPRTTSILSGGAFAAHVVAGKVATAGPEWPVGVCGSTGGQVRSNGGASLNVPGVLQTGTATDTATATSTSNSASGEATSTVQNAAALGNLVSADLVKADATVSQNGSTVTTSDQGSSFVNLVVNGQAMPANVPANTKISVGNVTVWLHRVFLTAHGTGVRMIEINVHGSNPFSLPVGADIVVAQANMTVFPAG